jgi:transglutaminase-like putative cysteine protease
MGRAEKAIRIESANWADYLASDDIIDWRRPEVLAKAKELTAAMATDVDRARCLFEWVRDRIPHSKDIDSDVVTCRASEVLLQGTGICYAKSHLLAAFLRAVGIPAGFCYQVLRRDPPFQGLVLHGLNGIYLESAAQWVRVDARGNVGGINARFALEREQLAFPTDARAGEFLYDTVFVSPAPVVVSTLKRFKSRQQMWPHLPSRLESP